MISLLAAAALALSAIVGGCAKEPDDAVDKAVENTKDALDVRDHEKLKDAGEEAKDAVKDATEGVKDEAKDAAPKSN
jgi:phosphate uptake regulator